MLECPTLEKREYEQDPVKGTRRAASKGVEGKPRHSGARVPRGEGNQLCQMPLTGQAI